MASWSGWSAIKALFPISKGDPHHNKEFTLNQKWHFPVQSIKSPQENTPLPDKKKKKKCPSPPKNVNSHQQNKKSPPNSPPPHLTKKMKLRTYGKPHRNYRSTLMSGQGPYPAKYRSLVLNLEVLQDHDRAFLFGLGRSLGQPKTWVLRQLSSLGIKVPAI